MSGDVWEYLKNALSEGYTNLDAIAEKVRSKLNPVRHGDSGKPTWANERICICGGMYRVMPPGPSLEDHIEATRSLK